MKPILFSIGKINIPAFFLMIMIATLAATFYGYKLAKKEGADPIVILDFGIIAIIASVIGSRLFHIFIENPSYYYENPIRIFYFWQGGFVSVGAFVFTIISWIVYVKVRRLEGWRYFDISAAIVPVSIFFVRLGCFFAGCCYGKPTHFFIHLVFKNPASAGGAAHPGVPLHATQVYSMINALIMGIILYFVYRYKKFHGQVLAIFLMYYGVSRFFIEFLRGDEDRGLFFGKMLSTGQIAMIFSFISGIVIYFVLCSKNKKKA